MKQFSESITRHDLKRLRKKYNLDQKKIGKIFGLSAQQISNIEVGRVPISGPTKAFLRTFKVIDFFGSNELINIFLDRKV